MVEFYTRQLVTELLQASSKKDVLINMYILEFVWNFTNLKVKEPGCTSRKPR